ncbi:hypothetical protein BBF96_01700 [Anoxybacter fermentans]|uniref:ABC transporter substrate-binding protein n=1 Tax=Anoxybacter fermentans TaxID=1323375 RepID=A0A3Q9HNP7_9FIRM|nr:ABC transporter substrate-binding protein [Anoxybacter fermentans]AZR72221.1 hypothetical protein BBF96_01700 [Anoxybacter fermentans]
MKRFILLTLLVALVMGLVVLPAAAKDKITVTFWHAMSKGHAPYLEDIIKRFNESQDKIEVVPIYQGSYGDLNKKLMGSIAAGKPPVMAQVYEDWTTKLVDAGVLEAAEWYIGSVFTQEEIDDIILIFQKSNMWNDTLYTLPFNKSTNVLFVNLDMVPKVPTTWDELLEAAKAATKDEDGDGTPEVYGFGIRPTVDTFNIFLRQAGGTFLNEDGTKAVFNNEAGQKALQFLHDMVYKHKVAMVYTGYLSGPIGEGKIAMYQGSSAGIPYVAKAIGDKFKWTVAPLVMGEKAAAPFMGTNIAVFKSHPDEVKYAAMEFIKFLINTENTTYWAVNTGYLPVRYSALKTKEWKEYIAADSKNAAGPSQFDYGTFDPRPNGWSEIRKVISEYIQKALLNKMTVKEALDAAAEKVDKILARNK